MLNSLKDYKKTSIGSKVLQTRPLNKDGSVNWDLFDKQRETAPIFFDHKVDMISFKVMTKPASEGGTGGQWTDMIEVGLHMLEYFQDKFPCDENVETIDHLRKALKAQYDRTKDREARGVEGKDED